MSTSVSAKSCIAPARVARGRSTRGAACTASRARGVVVASADAKRVVVVGGSGFVGGRVVERLGDMGVDVTSVSKSGKGGIAVDLSTDACADALKDAFEGADAVISCVGIFGADDATLRAGNGDYNVRAIEAAKAAGVPRFVLVSVASIVSDVVGETSLMKGYFEGKSAAEAALRDNYPESNSLVVRPSFVYGGDAFSVNPPRVTQQYGDILVKLLGAGPIKAIAERSPGPIALTLAEPQSVADVAAACVAGAMGANPKPVADGTDDIKACAASA